MKPSTEVKAQDAPGGLTFYCLSLHTSNLAHFSFSMIFVGVPEHVVPPLKHSRAAWYVTLDAIPETVDRG